MGGTIHIGGNPNNTGNGLGAGGSGSGLSSIAAADYKADAWANVAGRSVTYTPHIPNLGSSSSSSLAGGYVGVAESHSSLHSHAGIGAGIHDRWVEPLPIQPVQTVAVSKPPPVVKKQVFVPKPVVTKEMTQAEIVEWNQYFITKDKSKIKAKAIVEKIVIDQKGGDVKFLDLSNTRLSSADMDALMNELEYINFDLDVLSLENTPFDHTGGGLGGLGGFMRIFTHHEKGVFHNVTYLNLTNACDNSTYGGDTLATAISQALGRGDLSTTKVINLSGNKITDDHGVRNIALAMQTGNFNLEQFNLSDNKITDKGAKAIGEALETGKVKNLKNLNVSGNNITKTGDTYFVKALQNPAVQDMIILTQKVDDWTESKKMAQLTKNLTQPGKEIIDTVVDGIKKQGTFVLGSKEAKQGIIQDWLDSAQSHGVDTKNVTVSKDIFAAIKNLGKLYGNFHLGWAKCSIVPTDIKSAVANKIIAVASPEAGIIKTGIDIVTCYFESFDESASSQRGLQFMGDIGLLSHEVFTDAIE